MCGFRHFVVPHDDVYFGKSPLGECMCDSLCLNKARHGLSGKRQGDQSDDLDLACCPNFMQKHEECKDPQQELQHIVNDEGCPRLCDFPMNLLPPPGRVKTADGSICYCDSSCVVAMRMHSTNATSRQDLSNQCCSNFVERWQECKVEDRPTTSSPTLSPTKSPTTKAPTPVPTRSPSASPTAVLVTPRPTMSSGFDWGEGCAGGDGSFTLNLPNAGETADVGIIPKGKFSVRVALRAKNDIDIALYDIDDTAQWKEGRAVVAWCPTGGCNMGLLGALPGIDQAVYTNANGASFSLSYSGYNGDGSGLGNEWIEITGEATTTLQMRAYAYSAGDAEVTYSWGRSQTACCKGEAPCGGSFKQKIAKNDIVEVGRIPVGKRDVYIQLNSDKDVDIQLYDTTDTTRFEEGRAIVGWCPNPPKCNLGIMYDSKYQDVRYPQQSDAMDTREYQYSGYNGVSGVGDEFIRIVGVTNRELLMTAFGYTDGVADVSYTYFEVLDHEPGTTAIATATATARSRRSRARASRVAPPQGRMGRQRQGGVSKQTPLQERPFSP